MMNATITERLRSEQTRREQAAEMEYAALVDRLASGQNDDLAADLLTIVEAAGRTTAGLEQDVSRVAARRSAAELLANSGGIEEELAGIDARVRELEADRQRAAAAFVVRAEILQKQREGVSDRERAVKSARDLLRRTAPPELLAEIESTRRRREETSAAAKDIRGRLHQLRGIASDPQDHRRTDAIRLQQAEETRLANAEAEIVDLDARLAELGRETLNP